MTQGSESARSAHSAPPPVDTVLQHFERRAGDSPGSTAVIAGPDSLTYGELDARANRLAHHLIATGLPPGGLVALGTARPAELVVALLGVLKAGGCYVVLDVETSGGGRSQLAALAASSSAASSAPSSVASSASGVPYAVLTHAAHQARLDDGRGLRFVRLGAEADEIARQPAERPAPRTGAGTPVLLQFTGGTGTRAVALAHPVLLAAYDAWAEVARFTPGDRHLITAAPDLPAFATGWTRALCSGGALVVPERTPWTPDAIRRAVADAGVTALHTDPAGAARLLLRDRRTALAKVPRQAARAAAPESGAAPRTSADSDAGLRTLRLVTVAGARLYLDELASLQARLRPGARLLSVYGPAEAAGTGARFELPQLPGPLDEPEGLALLGLPFPGARVDLHAGEMRLTPPGGGDAIATGDLARLRPDGLLEFGGRIRDRITLHGRSLDPHPLESLIRASAGPGGGGGAGVGVGGVLVAEDPATRRLVAYVTPPPGQDSAPAADGLPDVAALRARLRGRVPEADIPQTVVRLRALPRSRGGQEDRAALPLPAQPPDPMRPRGSGKYGAAGPAEFPVGCAVFGVLVAGLLVRSLTGVFWPGSTDLTHVPQPWAALFTLLYLCESWAFVGGVLFLLAGRSRMRRRGRGRLLAGSAHLAVVYLLVAWWPQDNLYRLADKHDWPRQAALVYAFNVPLMIAAAIVALYVLRVPAAPADAARADD